MFNNDSNWTRVLAVFMAIAMVSVGGAIAAEPSLDDETTNTSTTSDVAEGDVIEDFNASASEYTYIEYTADSDQSSLAVQDPDTGTTYYSNSSVMTTDETNGHYAVNISHDDLSRVPVEANANTTVEVAITNNTEVDNPDTYTFNLTLAADGSRTVIDLNEDVASDDDIFSSETVGLFNIKSLAGIIGDHDVSEFEQDDLSIDGSNSTVEVYLTNTTAQESFANATEGTEAGTLDVHLKSTMESGDDEITVPHFVDEAPDDVPDGQTYGVYDTDSNKVTYHLSEEDFEGKDEIDTLSVSSGDALGWTSVLSFSRDFGFGILTQKAIPGVGPLF